MLSEEESDVGALELLGTARVDQQGQWRELKRIAVGVLDGLQDGGGEIGATADWLGEDDVGRVRAELIGDTDEFGEAAAEATAGDLACVETARSREFRID